VLTKKFGASVTFWEFSATYIVRGLKTSCRELNNASELRVGQGSGQLNIRTSGRADVTFRFALVHIKPSCGNTGDSASELRAIDKRFERAQGGATNKATIAQRYGKALPL
jgi:hypothetical protein